MFLDQVEVEVVPALVNFIQQRVQLLENGAHFFGCATLADVTFITSDGIQVVEQCLGRCEDVWLLPGFVALKTDLADGIYVGPVGVHGPVTGNTVGALYLTPLEVLEVFALLIGVVEGVVTGTTSFGNLTEVDGTVLRLGVHALAVCGLLAGLAGVAAMAVCAGNTLAFVARSTPPLIIVEKMFMGNAPALVGMTVNAGVCQGHILGAHQQREE